MGRCGHTEGCEGCSRKRAKMEPRLHSEKCRSRIWEDMKKDDWGRAMIEKENHRIDEKLRNHASRQAEGSVAEPEQAMEVDMGDDSEGARPASRTAQQQGTHDTEMIMHMMQVSSEVHRAEIYSPPRVTMEGQKWGLSAGEAMDLTTGWDFRLKEHRDKAWEYVQQVKPRLAIGSPMCTMFSRLQGLSPWNDRKQEKWVEAVAHIRFVVAIYRLQMRNGRWFLHEHPASATSWGLREVQQLRAENEVMAAEADQCMYGLKTNGPGGRMVPAQKPTRFLTNSWAIAGELNQKCDRSRTHQPLLGGRAGTGGRIPQGPM